VRRTVLQVSLTLAGGALITLATFFPSYWVLGFDPPARIQIVSQWALVCTLMLSAYWAGRLLGHIRLTDLLRFAVRPATVLAVLGLTAVPVMAATREASNVPSAAAYAGEWDRNDSRLRAAREQALSEVTVPALPAWWGWDWVGPRPDDFPNRCVARYYGLEVVRSVPSAS
jgi:hypothetical protein